MKKLSGKSHIKVPGFTFSGISAGIKQSKDKDLALILSNTPAVTAGVFTTNQIKAAPVQLAMKNILSRKGQSIIINSGNANACTGPQGLKDAIKMQTTAASLVDIPTDLMYVSSTGVIGKPLPVSIIVKSLPLLVSSLSISGINDTAQAIMTTDTYEKVFSKKLKIGSKIGSITAIAKGSGMICPNMATMLCFIVTDISLSYAALDAALRSAVNQSFNMLSVDNDMSTNDTVMIMANGALGNKTITQRSPYYNSFKKTLNSITYELAKMIADDGEGATKTIEVIVTGAGSESDAISVAKAVSGSMLVKTALYGRDPNWGRIIAAIGYSGAAIREERIEVLINNIKLISKGTGTKNEHKVQKKLEDNRIVITINLGLGTGTARALSCDLTEGYIEINAHYTT